MSRHHRDTQDTEREPTDPETSATNDFLRSDSQPGSTNGTDLSYFMDQGTNPGLRLPSKAHSDTIPDTDISAGTPPPEELVVQLDAMPLDDSTEDSPEISDLIIPDPKTTFEIIHQALNTHDFGTQDIDFLQAREQIGTTGLVALYQSRPIWDYLHVLCWDEIMHDLGYYIIEQQIMGEVDKRFAKAIAEAPKRLVFLHKPDVKTPSACENPDNISEQFGTAFGFAISQYLDQSYLEMDPSYKPQSLKIGFDASYKVWGDRTRTQAPMLYHQHLYAAQKVFMKISELAGRPLQPSDLPFAALAENLELLSDAAIDIVPDLLHGKHFYRMDINMVMTPEITRVTLEDSLQLAIQFKHLFAEKATCVLEPENTKLHFVRHYLPNDVIYAEETL
ncbi:hypothetical protein ACFL0V_05925 [Nanoarchaeota archaeon]